MFTCFETQDYRIRKIEISDAVPIYENWARKMEVARYTTWLPHKSLVETTAYVEKCIVGWSNDNFTWTIENKATSEISGSFAARVDGHKIEIGYLLAPRHWGKGIMTDVVSSFIGKSFQNQTVQRVGAVCDVQNPASRKVMEKAGMQYEGILASWMLHPNMVPKARDCYCLGISRERYNEYERRRN